MAAREVESLPALDALLASGQPLTGLRLQDLDLRHHEAELLARTDLTGLVVLGGRLSPALDAHLRAHHALVFPTDPHAPVDPYRATLYSPDELYEGLAARGYAATPDARAYRWTRDGSTHRDAFATPKGRRMDRRHSRNHTGRRASDPRPIPHVRAPRLCAQDER